MTSLLFSFVHRNYTARTWRWRKYKYQSGFCCTLVAFEIWRTLTALSIFRLAVTSFKHSATGRDFWNPRRPNEILL